MKLRKPAWAIATLIVAAGLLALPSVAWESQPERASSFLDRIGVNTHLSYTDGRYVDTRQVLDDLRFIGVGVVRDYSLQQGGQGQNSYKDLASAGIRFDLFIFGWPIDPALEQIRDFSIANPGAVVAIEGPNEVNNFPVTYAGVSGSSGAVAYQKALYEAIKADPALEPIQVYNLTSYPDLSAKADVANAHAYAKGGDQPYWAIARSLATQRLVMLGKPIALTETGYYTLINGQGWGGVDENTQARLTLNSIFDSRVQGVDRIFLYQLLDAYADPEGKDQEKHFGLFDLSNRPKAAAKALHNLTTILNDTTAHARTFSTQPLSFKVDAPLNAAKTILLQAASGRYSLIVWGEPKLWNNDLHKAISPAATDVTVNFNRPMSHIAVYDPIEGSNVVSQQGTARSVKLVLGADPIIVTFN